MEVQAANVRPLIVLDAKSRLHELLYFFSGTTSRTPLTVRLTRTSLMYSSSISKPSSTIICLPFTSNFRGRRVAAGPEVVAVGPEVVAAGPEGVEVPAAAGSADTDTSLDCGDTAGVGAWKPCLGQGGFGA